MTPTVALALWRRAAEEEIGIIISLADPADKRRAEGALYDARKEARDPTLADLMIAKPGDAPHELWIIKKTTDMRDVNASPTLAPR